MDLDVTELLVDANVGAEGFRVIRRRETINQYGESTMVESDLGIQQGSVYPTGQQSLVRAEAYETQLNTITVVTRFRLYSAGTGQGQNYQPDLVVWSGERYIVKSVNEYTAYGAGFLQAECVVFAYNTNEPTDRVPYVGTLDMTQVMNSGNAGAFGS